jgi:peptidoglycan hydrolase-like protein with peptidoglycan-binding domain
MIRNALRLSMALALGASLGGIAYAQGTTAPGAATPPAEIQPPATGAPTPATPGTGSATSNPAAPNTTAPGATAPSYHAGPARLSPALVKEAQQQLKSEGLYNGAIDGRVGPQTRTAVRQFQQQNGLKTTAMLDHETLQRLMANHSHG